MTQLWTEVKEWRSHWKLSKFLQALILGLAASLFDIATDFHFAESVEEDCGFDEVHEFDFASPCGSAYYKNVKRATYTFIAFPGVFLGFALVHSVVRKQLGGCWGNGTQEVLQGLWSVFDLTLEVCVFIGMFVLAIRSDRWFNGISQTWIFVYDYSIQALAYISATLVIGIKCFGIFFHGPKSCRLVFETKDTETKFESTHQLSLLAVMYISSGIGSSASLLSAISAIIMLCVNSVQTFLRRHDEKLAETSILGKLMVALSVLPVFLLTNVFKNFLRCFVLVWSPITSLIVCTLLVSLPNLALLILKMCHQFEDLTFAYVNQSVISDILGFHLWPKSFNGKRIGLAMTLFTFFLIAAPGIFLIKNPKPTPRQWMEELNLTSTDPQSVFKEWERKTSERLHIDTIACLMIGCLAFVLVVALILFEDRWVEYVMKYDPITFTESDIISSF